MKKLLIVLYNVIILSCSHAQDHEFVKYINSYKAYEPSTILNFAKIVQNNNPMTIDDAVKYVYKGDSTRLYCTQRIINIETEKVEGITRDLYLPSKCLRLNMGKYFIIAYSSFLCQNLRPIENLLHLEIIDNNFELRDSLIVYKGTDFESEINGLLNPNNGSIFLISHSHDNNLNQAYIYGINSESLKFEIVKQQNNLSRTTDNLDELLDQLEWKDIFMN